MQTRDIPLEVVLEFLPSDDLAFWSRDHTAAILISKKRSAEISLVKTVNFRSSAMAEPEPGTYKVAEAKTAPFDARFPNTNQARYCWQGYIDFHRCTNIRGEDFEPCQYFRHVYRAMCPKSWTEAWDEQREGGTFAGRV
ncbi:uncharacterized protein [Branchiostoma lanceolatum]|uniref:uncharacterized protein n=1 Tax=Branchiostoma lanceolatum TaxID=7740 RepID=UPI00345218B0